MIKPLLFCALLVAAAGYPAYQFLQPPDYGVSPADPIGEFKKIDEFLLQWESYQRTVGEVSEELAFEFGKQYEGHKKYMYDWKDKRENGYPRFVTLVVDQMDRVLAVRAEFPSKSQTPRKPELSSEELVHRLWTDLARREPSYRRVKGYDGFLHVDSFTAPGLKGTWTKSYKVPTNERSICDVVVIYRADDGE